MRLRFWSAGQGRAWARIMCLLLSHALLWPFLTWGFGSPAYAMSHPAGIADRPRLQLPAAWGSITETHQAGPEWVVYIQDLHCNYEVQQNIGRLVGYLVEHRSLRLVAVEGASQPVNLTDLSRFPLAWARRDIGRYFLREGKMTGPEYLAAAKQPMLRLEGIEDAALYHASRQAVTRFVNEESQGLIYDLREALDAVKPRIYTAELLAHDRQRRKFQEGQLSLLQYAVFLRSRALDAKAVGPNLAAYLADPRQSRPRPMDSDALYRELEHLDRQLRRPLYTAQSQEQLDALEHRLDILDRLVNISVTPQELAEYRRQPEAFQAAAFVDFIKHHAPDLELDPELARIDHYLSEIALFYQLADERSRVFARNLASKLRARAEKIAVLITGGYHVQETTAELKRRGISYVCVRPSLTRQDVANPYFGLLREHRTPLEKLLAKNQDILSLPTHFPQTQDPEAVVTDFQQFPQEVRSFHVQLRALKDIALTVEAADAGRPGRFRRLGGAWLAAGRDGLIAVLRAPGQAVSGWEQRSVALTMKQWHVALFGGSERLEIEARLAAETRRPFAGIREGSARVAVWALAWLRELAGSWRDAKGQPTAWAQMFAGGVLAAAATFLVAAAGGSWFLGLAAVGAGFGAMVMPLAFERASLELAGHALPGQQVSSMKAFWWGLPFALLSVVILVSGQPAAVSPWSTVTIAASAVFLGTATLGWVGYLLGGRPGPYPACDFLKTAVEDPAVDFFEVQTVDSIKVLKVNSRVKAGLTWFRPTTQNVLLYGLGIVGHETAHLAAGPSVPVPAVVKLSKKAEKKAAKKSRKGREPRLAPPPTGSELHAYAVMQGLPAAAGAFLVGGLAAAVGAPLWLVAGLAVIAGLGMTGLIGWLSRQSYLAAAAGAEPKSEAWIARAMGRGGSLLVERMTRAIAGWFGIAITPEGYAAHRVMLETLWSWSLALIANAALGPGLVSTLLDPLLFFLPGALRPELPFFTAGFAFFLLLRADSLLWPLQKFRSWVTHPGNLALAGAMVFAGRAAYRLSGSSDALMLVTGLLSLLWSQWFFFRKIKSPGWAALLSVSASLRIYLLMALVTAITEMGNPTAEALGGFAVVAMMTVLFATVQSLTAKLAGHVGAWKKKLPALGMVAVFGLVLWLGHWIDRPPALSGPAFPPAAVEIRHPGMAREESLPALAPLLGESRPTEVHLGRDAWHRVAPLLAGDDAGGITLSVSQRNYAYLRQVEAMLGLPEHLALPVIFYQGRPSSGTRVHELTHASMSGEKEFYFAYFDRPSERRAYLNQVLDFRLRHPQASFRDYWFSRQAVPLSSRQRLASIILRPLFPFPNLEQRLWEDIDRQLDLGRTLEKDAVEIGRKILQLASQRPAFPLDVQAWHHFTHLRPEQFRQGMAQLRPGDYDRVTYPHPLFSAPDWSRLNGKMLTPGSAIRLLDIKVAPGREGQSPLAWLKLRVEQVAPDQPYAGYGFPAAGEEAWIAVTELEALEGFVFQPAPGARQQPREQPRTRLAGLGSVPWISLLPLLVMAMMIHQSTATPAAGSRLKRSSRRARWGQAPAAGALAFKAVNALLDQAMPSEINVMLTKNCPFNCGPCLALLRRFESGEKDTDQRTLKQWISLFAGLDRLYLVGPGETLAYGQKHGAWRQQRVSREFLELVHFAAPLYQDLVIVTNGYLIPTDPAAAEAFFSQFPPNVLWFLSVDEYHEGEMRRVMGKDLKAIVRVMEDLQARGRIKVFYNLRHEGQAQGERERLAAVYGLAHGLEQLPQRLFINRIVRQGGANHPRFRGALPLKPGDIREHGENPVKFQLFVGPRGTVFSSHHPAYLSPAERDRFFSEHAEVHPFAILGRLIPRDAESVGPEMFLNLLDNFPKHLLPDELRGWDVKTALAEILDYLRKGEGLEKIQARRAQNPERYHALLFRLSPMGDELLPLLNALFGSELLPGPLMQAMKQPGAGRLRLWLALHAAAGQARDYYQAFVAAQQEVLETFFRERLQSGDWHLAEASLRVIVTLQNSQSPEPPARAAARLVQDLEPLLVRTGYSTDVALAIWGQLEPVLRRQPWSAYGRAEWETFLRLYLHFLKLDAYAERNLGGQGLVLDRAEPFREQLSLRLGRWVADLAAARPELLDPADGTRVAEDVYQTRFTQGVWILSQPLRESFAVVLHALVSPVPPNPADRSLWAGRVIALKNPNLEAAAKLWFQPLLGKRSPAPAPLTGASVVWSWWGIAADRAGRLESLAGGLAYAGLFLTRMMRHGPPTLIPSLAMASYLLAPAIVIFAAFFLWHLPGVYGGQPAGRLTERFRQALVAAAVATVFTVPLPLAVSAAMASGWLAAPGLAALGLVYSAAILISSQAHARWNVRALARDARWEQPASAALEASREPEVPTNAPLLFDVHPIFLQHPVLHRGWLLIQSLLVRLASLAWPERRATPNPGRMQRLAERAFARIPAELQQLLKHPGQLRVEVLSWKRHGFAAWLAGQLWGQAEADADGLVTLRVPGLLAGMLGAELTPAQTGGRRIQRWAEGWFQHLVKFQSLRLTGERLRRLGIRPQAADQELMPETEKELPWREAGAWTAQEYWGSRIGAVTIPAWEMLRAAVYLLPELREREAAQLRALSQTWLVRQPSSQTLLQALEHLEAQDHPVLQVVQAMLREAARLDHGAQEAWVAGALSVLATLAEARRGQPVADAPGRNAAIAAVQVTGLPGAETEALVKALEMSLQQLPHAGAEALQAVLQGLRASQGQALDHAATLDVDSGRLLAGVLAEMPGSIVASLGEELDNQKIYLSHAGVSEQAIRPGLRLAVPVMVEAVSELTDPGQLAEQISQNQVRAGTSLRRPEFSLVLPSRLRERAPEFAAALKRTAPVFTGRLAGVSLALHGLAASLAPGRAWTEAVERLPQELKSTSLYWQLRGLDTNSADPLAIAYRRMVMKRTPASRAEFSKIIIRMIKAEQNPGNEWLAFSAFLGNLGHLPMFNMALPDRSHPRYSSLPARLQTARVALPLALLEARNAKGALGYAVTSLEVCGFEVDREIIRLFLQRGFIRFGGSA